MSVEWEDFARLSKKAAHSWTLLQAARDELELHEGTEELVAEIDRHLAGVPDEPDEPSGEDDDADASR